MQIPGWEGAKIASEPARAERIVLMLVSLSLQEPIVRWAWGILNNSKVDPLTTNLQDLVISQE